MKKMDAYTVYLLMRGGHVFAMRLAFTMFLVFQVEVLHMNPLELVLAGTVLEVVYFLFEVPTGVVADLFSRRLSVLIGIAVMGAGFIMTGLSQGIALMMIAQAVLALGFTFESGASEAWIVDEIGEDRSARAFLRGNQAANAGAIMGVIVAAPLAIISRGLPIVLGGAVMIALTGLLALVMPEDGFKPVPAEERETWRSAIRATKSGVQMIRTRPVLLMLVMVAVIGGLWSEGYDRLWVDHLIGTVTLPVLRLPLVGELDPVVWFSLIGVVSEALVIAVTGVIDKRMDITDQRQAAVGLTWVYGLVAGGLVIFAVGRSFPLMLGALWLTNTARGVAYPIYATWINKYIDSDIRATVISMTGQADAIGQITGGPVVGLVGLWVSVRAALVTSALLLAPNLFLPRVAAYRGEVAVAAGQTAEQILPG